MRVDTISHIQTGADDSTGYRRRVDLPDVLEVKLTEQTANLKIVEQGLETYASEYVPTERLEIT